MTGHRPGHALGKWHRRAALQRLHHGDAVHQPVIIGCLPRFIGDLRMAEDTAVAIETDDHGNVHVRIGAPRRRRPPAAAQSCEYVLDGIDLGRLSPRRRDQGRQQQCCG
jgi:hypothetical protein